MKIYDEFGKAVTAEQAKDLMKRRRPITLKGSGTLKIPEGVILCTPSNPERLRSAPMDPIWNGMPVCDPSVQVPEGGVTMERTGPWSWARRRASMDSDAEE